MALKFVLALYLTFTLFLAHASNTSARELHESDCLNALKELKSCTKEIAIYFTDGTPDIGPRCCQAITMLTHQCWPAMMTGLGFTVDECDVLRGYCDAYSDAYSAPALGPVASNTEDGGSDWD